MGNRSAADADAPLAGRGAGTGAPGAAAAAAALAGGVLLIGAVLAGNALVCVSVAAERALQTPTNYFVVSLAAADLLLALLVLPLFVYSQVSAAAPARTSLAPLSPAPVHARTQRGPAACFLGNPIWGGSGGRGAWSQHHRRLRFLGTHPSPISQTVCPFAVGLSTLFLLSLLSQRLLPKGRSCPSGAARAGDLDSPSPPPSWVPVRRGASWTYTQIQAAAHPRLSLGRRDTHIAAQGHGHVKPGARTRAPRARGAPHSRTDSVHSGRATQLPGDAGQAASGGRGDLGRTLGLRGGGLVPVDNRGHPGPGLALG